MAARTGGLGMDGKDGTGTDAPDRSDGVEALRQAMIASGAGTWAWEAATNTEIWDRVFRQQFGFRTDEPATYDAWLGRIHPEDRAMVEARVGRMLTCPGDDLWDAEFRICLPEGEVRWMRGFGRADRDPGGSILRISGVNFDVTEAHANQEDLRVSEARLRLAAEVAELGMIEIDYLKDRALPDARAAELFGLPALRPVPRERVHALFHPEDRAEIHRLIAACLDPEGTGSFRMEHRILRDDGSMVWLLVKKQVVFDTIGGVRRPVSGLLVAMDVTQRRAAEERSIQVMHESAHRTRNLLMLIDVVARQTAALGYDDFLPRFGARLKALGANQELLLGSGRDAVPLEDLLRAQLAHFQDLIDTRIRILGGPVEIGPAAAQALGMALHELATNAGKHGALSGLEGRVDVRWERNGKAFTMTWIESGGPPVARPSRTGFGSMVVGRMVESALDAQVEIDHAPEGLRWSMTCPATAL